MNKTEPLIKMVLLFYGLGDSVSFKGWQSVKCPFHDDTTASASVNLDQDGFKCHACGTKGNSISLVMKQEGLDFAGAVEFLAEELGISDEEIRERRRVSSKLSKSKRNSKRGRPPLPPGSRKGPDKRT